METLPRKWVRDIVTMTNLLSGGKVKQYRRYTNCESSSVGRAQPCQGWGRGFESRLSLHWSGSSVGQNTCLSRMGSRVRIPSRPQLAFHPKGVSGEGVKKPLFVAVSAWGISSAGQSTCLARKGSSVRLRYPPHFCQTISHLGGFLILFGIYLYYRDVAQLVAHLVWDQRVARSSRVIPTKFKLS